MSDAEELAARRAFDLQQAAKYRGWKPLTIWYAFWTAMFAVAAVVGLVHGQVGGFFAAVVVGALCAKYTHYLYHGGRRRVWFVIF